MRNAAQYGLDANASKRILKALSPLFDRYDWPGNVRELENLLARAAIYLDNDVARHAQTLHEVFPELLRVSTEKPPPEQQAAEASATAAPVTYTVALAALEAAGGNRAAASRALGISRTTF